MQYKHPNPGFFAWAGIIVCGAFFILLLMGMREGSPELAGGKGYAFLVMLGGALVTALWRIARRFREAGTVADAARVPVGVPIRPSRGRALAVAGGLAIIGIAALAFVQPLAPVVHWGAWICIALAAGVAAGVAAGILPRGYIELRDDVLLIAGLGYNVGIPWHRIRALEGSEYLGNPALYFWFDAAETFPVTPPDRQDRFLRQVATWNGMLFLQADFCMMTTPYGIAMPDLLAAIMRRCGPLLSPDEIMDERTGQRA